MPSVAPCPRRNELTLTSGSLVQGRRHIRYVEGCSGGIKNGKLETAHRHRVHFDHGCHPSGPSASQPIRFEFGYCWEVLAAPGVSQTIQEIKVLIRTCKGFGACPHKRTLVLDQNLKGVKSISRRNRSHVPTVTSLVN